MNRTFSAADLAVLVLDRDGGLVRSLREGYSFSGMQVDGAVSSGECTRKLMASFYDALLVGEFPEGGGLEFVRFVREQLMLDVPLIMVCRLTPPERKEALLDAGADACPDFSGDQAELRAWIMSFARRARSLDEGPLLECGGLELDMPRRLASFKGRSVRLRPGAAKMLALLMRDAPRPVDTRKMWHLVHGGGAVNGNSLNVRLHQLRRQLEDGLGCGLLETVPWVAAGWPAQLGKRTLPEVRAGCFSHPRMPRHGRNFFPACPAGSTWRPTLSGRPAGCWKHRSSIWSCRTVFCVPRMPSPGVCRCRLRCLCRGEGPQSWCGQLCREQCTNGKFGCTSSRPGAPSARESCP